MRVNLSIPSHDLNNEMAGREVGKISRFIGNKEREKREDSNNSTKLVQTQLSLMLTNAAYASAYGNAMVSLDSAESAIYEAMINASEEVERSSRALEKAEESNVGSADVAILEQKHDENTARFELMQTHDTELGDIRARIEDENSPPSLAELAELEARSKEIETSSINSRNQKLEFGTAKPVTAPELEITLKPM